MSQSLVNESGGARTPLSGLISSLLILLVAVFFSETLRNLPQPVLAAIVLLAVTGLFKVAELRRLWKFHRAEFFIALAALLGVLWAGLLRGVLIGAVISLVLLIRRVSAPHVAFSEGSRARVVTPISLGIRITNPSRSSSRSGGSRDRLF